MSRNISNENNSQRFEDLKNRIYTLYMQICKAQFLGKDLKSFGIEEEYDNIVAGVCVCHMEEELSMTEFKTLSAHLIKVYEVYRLGD